MTAERIIGFILLLLGAAIILYALFGSYGIFTGAQEPPEIFEASKAERTTETGSGELDAQVQALLQDQLKDILPDEAMPKAFNLFAWSILAGILIFGGSQVAGLGVKLLKK
jgi:hypothetical protein